MSDLITPLLVLLFTGAIIGAVVFIARDEQKRRAARPQLAIKARQESDYAWSVAGKVFAEVAPKLADEDKPAVLNAVYARILIALEDRK